RQAGARLGARALQLPARDDLVARCARRDDAQPQRGPFRPLRRHGRLRRRQGARVLRHRRAGAEPRRRRVALDGAARARGSDLRPRRPASRHRLWRCVRVPDARKRAHLRGRGAADPWVAQRLERIGGLRACLCFEDFRAGPGPEELQGPPAPAGAHRPARRRRLVRRLQGHQRRRDRRRPARPEPPHRADPRRRRQGPGFLAAGGPGTRVRFARAPHRPRRPADRESHGRRALRFARKRGAAGRAPGESGRGGAALARVRELRHVPRLQAPGRGVRRRGEEAGMSQTFVFARNAPDAEYDRALAWAALLLLTLGLVMVYSASIATAESSRYTGNNAVWFLARHTVFLAAALGAALTVFLVPVRYWQRLAPWLFIAGVALLAAVLVPGIGRDVNGARRWLALPLVSVQPSELMKLAAVLYAADYTVR